MADEMVKNIKNIPLITAEKMIYIWHTISLLFNPVVFNMQHTTFYPNQSNFTHHIIITTLFNVFSNMFNFFYI